MNKYLFLLTALLMLGCSQREYPLVPRVADVDLSRFSGDWYVIAAIPTWIERESFNAVERYELAPDGTIATTFTFNNGALNGPRKEYHPTGFIRPGTNNAEWGMQFLWPIKAQFVISHLDPNYQETIIARDDRDYVWIMARTPHLEPSTLEALVERVRTMGYDTTQLRMVPHNYSAFQKF